MSHSHHNVSPLKIQKRFYFGGGSKPQSQAMPDPTPVPTPSDVSPLNSQQERTGKLAAMRFGLTSTIGAQGAAGGMTGQKPDLSSAALTPGQTKKTLGS
jgi:hypothetical protein